MMKLEDEINAFLNEWGPEELGDFLVALIPLIELYNVEEDSDWVKEAVSEGPSTVRLIRTVYLLSKLTDSYAEKLRMLKAKYGKLWLRMERSKELQPQSTGCAS